MRTEELLERMKYDKKYKHVCPDCEKHLAEEDTFLFIDGVEGRSWIISKCCQKKAKPRV